MVDVDLRCYVAFAAVLLLSCAQASAQKRISADIEEKQVHGGQSVTTLKSACCTRDGRLVVHCLSPREYYIQTDPRGEAKFYFPDTNEALSEGSGDFSSKDEFLSVFLMGRSEDLGLSLNGYVQVGTSREPGGIVTKTYKAGNPEDYPKVKLVLKDFLPIYCEYLDASGRVAVKSYISSYKPVAGVPFPHRITTISYRSAADSTIMRTLYSNVLTDSDHPDFGFQVPSDAKFVSMGPGR